MGYTNSGLVAYKKLSPNHSGLRTHSIDRITPHCVVGQCSAEGLGDWFAKSSTQASSNYGIDKDGRVGLYVEEKNRSWCSSSNANDQRAVTIECASDTSEPYAFRDAVYKKLITLCVDICKRNGKKKLLWLGSKDKTLGYSPKSDEMVLTVHRWFANKSCPGNWMYARMGDLASKVTAQLGGGSSSESSAPAATAPATTTKFPAVPFLVTVIIDDLNIRTSGSMSGKVVGQTGKGVFTITQVKDGWGKLKSGAGWIYLENPSYCTIGKAVSSDKKVLPQEEKEVKEEKVTGLKASALKDLSEEAVIKKVGALFTADQKKSGILASVSLSQFILESGYGKSELAQNANNCFGMKKSLSGNTWSGSSWDGKSIYTKKTGEQNPDGSYVTITADFRKYPCIEDSIADHSAYLLGAMNGSKQRYAGLKGCTDYKKAAQIIKDGGYATSLTYVDKLCSIIRRWDLTQYDVKAVQAKQPVNAGTSADKLIAVAAAEIGYHEKASNASLDDKTTNSGSANYTKYARDFDQKYPNWYNGKKNGYAWCDMFVDWCFLTAFGYEKALSLLCQPEKSAGAGCTYSLGYFKNKGQLFTSNPKPGDQIFFGTSQSDVSHTGIVEKVDSSKVYTIEGNTSDQVARRSYALTNSRIVGYGRPAYDKESSGSAAETEPTKYYRVRKSWEDKASQIGAFTVLENAILAVDANPGYAAFDDNGKQVYPKTQSSFKSYLVKVSISDLNYRKGPSTSYASWGYIEPGIYTIVDEQDGWGLLKAYADKRNGWIKLSYAKKL